MQKKLEKYHLKLEKDFQEKNNGKSKKEHKGSISPLRSQSLKRAASPRRAESQIKQAKETNLDDDKPKSQNDQFEYVTNQ